MTKRTNEEKGDDLKSFRKNKKRKLEIMNEETAGEKVSTSILRNHDHGNNNNNKNDDNLFTTTQIPPFSSSSSSYSSSSDSSNLYPKHACKVSMSEDFVKIGLSPKIKNMIPHSLFVQTNISSSQAIAVLLMLKQFFHYNNNINNKRSRDFTANESTTDNRGGFILSDGTGLGKTRILASLIYNLVYSRDDSGGDTFSSDNKRFASKRQYTFLWVTSNMNLFTDITKELHRTNKVIFDKINICTLNEYIDKGTNASTTSTSMSSLSAKGSVDKDDDDKEDDDDDKEDDNHSDDP